MDLNGRLVGALTYLPDSLLSNDTVFRKEVIELFIDHCGLLSMSQKERKEGRNM